MGTLKFYKPMQAVWEAAMFGTQAYESSMSSSYKYDNSRHLRYVDDTNGLIEYLYSNETLTSKVTGNTSFPVMNTSLGKPNTWMPFWDNSYTSGWFFNGIHGTSNTTHDLERTDLSNKVANASFTSSLCENGNLHFSVNLTNIDTSLSTTVKAIERVRRAEFKQKNSTSTGSEYYFLAWAYYLDEADWVELEAGESKLITIKITLNDLTQ